MPSDALDIGTELTRHFAHHFDNDDGAMVGKTPMDVVLNLGFVAAFRPPYEKQQTEKNQTP